jgi:hypothetical protein
MSLGNLGYFYGSVELTVLSLLGVLGISGSFGEFRESLAILDSSG